MKRQLAILTLVAAMMPVAPARAASTPEPAKDLPTVELVEPVHDFGRVPKGNVVSHDFEIRNTGKAPLELKQVAPDCGCTVTRYDRIIAPGATGKVHAEVDTKTLEGPTSRAIQVFTNDPEKPLVHLTFKAHVVALLKITPGYARYEVVQGETQPGIVKQTVYATDGKQYKVVDAESPWPYLETKIREASPDERHESSRADGDQWIVELQLDYNQAPVGPLADMVIVRTDHPDQERLEIPISGFVRPPLWSTPAEVDLGDIELEEPRGFSLVVQNFLSEEIEIEATSNLEGLEAEVEPIKEGRKFTIRCLIDPDEMAKGPFDATVTIKTNTPKAPTLEIPVRGTML